MTFTFVEKQTKHRFVLDCKRCIICTNTFCAAHSYKEILQLNRKVDLLTTFRDTSINARIMSNKRARTLALGLVV